MKMGYTRAMYMAVIIKAIKKFLEDRRKSNGGYADITEADVNQLHVVINLLVQAKCEPGPDGDYPVNWKVINRRVHEPMHFFPVPYSHKDPQGFIRASMENLRMAANHTVDAERLMKHLLEGKEK